MPILTPNFHFANRRCAQAIELYKRAFGAEVTCLLTGDDANPADWRAENEMQRQMVYHAEMIICGQRVLMSDADYDIDSARHGLSLVVTFDSADEVRAAFAILAEGGTMRDPMHSTSYSSCFVSLIDRYGMRWELMTEQTDR